MRPYRIKLSNEERRKLDEQIKEDVLSGKLDDSWAKLRNEIKLLSNKTDDQ